MTTDTLQTEISTFMNNLVKRHPGEDESVIVEQLNVECLKIDLNVFTFDKLEK